MNKVTRFCVEDDHVWVASDGYLVRATDYDALAAEKAEVETNAAVMLNEADLAYNRKTNDLIARHAEQVTALKARAEAAEAKVIERQDTIKHILVLCDWHLKHHTNNAETATPAQATRDNAMATGVMRLRAGIRILATPTPTPTADALMARITEGAKP